MGAVPSTQPPRPFATFILIAACIVGFGASHLLDGELDTLTLVCCGAKDYESIVHHGEWWRLISSGFLHGNLMHLLANGYGLFILGTAIERLWGSRRFLLIYTAGLLGGSTASLVYSPAVSVGASGAVFGLFGAVGVFATRHGRWLRPGARASILRQLLIIGAINIWLGITVPIIDNAAHVGGFVSGVVVAFLLQPVVIPRERTRGHEALLRLSTAACVGVLLFSVASAGHFAMTSRWIVHMRTRMESRSIGDGPLELHVPRGWLYTLPEDDYGWHVFERPGLASFALRLVPSEARPNAKTLLEERVAGWKKGGHRLLFTTESRLGPQGALEAHFVQKDSTRARLLVLPTPFGQTLLVTCLCRDRHYRLVEVLFDKMIQTIQLWPDRPQNLEALSYWQRIIKDPGDAEAAVGLASFYRTEGRLSAAEQMLLLALRVRGGYAPAHEQLAYLYATGYGEFLRPADAVRHARRAADLAPSNARYHATLALALEVAGDAPAALDAATAAARLAPDDARYTDLVQRLETAAGRNR